MARNLNNNTLENLSLALMEKSFVWKHEAKVFYKVFLFNSAPFMQSVSILADFLLARHAISLSLREIRPIASLLADFHLAHHTISLSEIV